ncbi:hypothetical protein DFH08DRAFT_821780 [Mycena albidolilacea]|uniref:Uncharacterized protein n=1 Tax=Mycena albidolilacea TaxID=1033008 RepID=A0AAD7ECV8_9AGAR|nr:hypothetical protein DFH08DRAFT_821780 [Mycena albidolilacea]
MDPIYFQDSLGNIIAPIWSSKDSIQLCSVLALPSQVAPKFLHYKDSVPLLLLAFARKVMLLDLDFTTNAVWYQSEQHWLGWISTGEPPRLPYKTKDVLNLLGICFQCGLVATIDSFYDAYNSDHQISPVEHVAGCHLNSAWIQQASYLGEHLHTISHSLAENCEFYCRKPPGNRLGDFPEPIDGSALEVLFSNKGEAQDAAVKAKRGILSLLRSLAWMLSLIQLSKTKLSVGDQKYLQELHLGDRPKNWSRLQSHKRPAQNQLSSLG